MVGYTLAQTRYRDLMGTHGDLDSRESRLQWEIRFAFKHGLLEAHRRNLKDELHQVQGRRTEIEEAKGPTQRELE